MKFGRNFHRYQIPEWTQYYVNYSGLKDVIKRAATQASRLDKQPMLEESYESLSGNVDTFTAFRQAKYSVVVQKERELCSRYGLNYPLVTIPNLGSLDEIESKDLVKSVIDLQTDLAKLQWFDRVNGEAISRLYDKLGKVGDSNDQRTSWAEVKSTYDEQCGSNIERLKELESDIIHSLQYHKSKLSRQSLFLQGKIFPFEIYPGPVYRTIVDDRPAALSDLLAQCLTDGNDYDTQYSMMLEHLLSFCIICRSWECCRALVAEIKRKGCFPIHPGCLNEFIVSFSRRTMPPRNNTHEPESETDETATKNVTVNLHSLFSDLLESGQIESGTLQAVEYRGRVPLHYSAAEGAYEVCEWLVDSLLHSIDAPSTVVDTLLLQDAEKCTPLHLAVIYGHTSVTSLFLDFFKPDAQSGRNTKTVQTDNLLRDLLFIALRYQHDDLVRLLSSKQSNDDHQFRLGETALHVAVQTGREDYVRLILRHKANPKACIDMTETTRGWTPLIFACAAGHLGIVEELLQAGADPTIVDYRGWMAKEHAAFRGHLRISKLLVMCKKVDPSGSLENARSRNSGANSTCIDNEGFVVVNLGGMQRNEQMRPVELNCCSSDYTQGRNPDNTFSIEVSMLGSSSYVLNLPVLDDSSSPLLFPMGKSSALQIMFKIFRLASAVGEKGRLIGSGTTSLKNIFSSCSPNRESLTRTHSVSILSKENLEFMGTVSFTYVIAKSFTGDTHPPTHQLLKTSGSVQLVGHRGFGQNTAAREYLQLGENTVEVTRDLEPVIYHDFSLSESGTDVPIHDVNLKQFLYAGKATLLDESAKNLWYGQTYGRKPRSRSLPRDDSRSVQTHERLQLTVDFVSKGFKPNSWGTSIQSPFATLEDLLVKLPDSLGFVVELKYPRLHEAADAGVAPVAIELNEFINATLDKIYRFGKGRNIILASFTPEVCILLSHKAKGYPIMFITNAGKLPITDMEKRGASLQVALQFAKQWSLTGVILAAETFLLCPRLIKYVQTSGLVCASYGLVNNVPANAKLQADAGIDMLIVDRVGLISRALSSAQETSFKN
ncbi:hypothetical protein PRK78_005322 [Emydomyces testavorans]|uniref:Glycerophosphodiester phosphodiesterase n=1 Tax=Emydomyces testavorans TaxID=2070801 RepID=A0AAF0DLV0_9EURO|nr:hypothetical protein PRK78_005322 [Emydomyces testavorans]